MQQDVNRQADELSQKLENTDNGTPDPTFIKYYEDQYKKSMIVPKDIAEDPDYQRAKEHSKQQKIQASKKNSVKWFNDESPKSSLPKVDSSEESSISDSVPLNDEAMYSALATSEKENDDSYSIASNNQQDQSLSNENRIKTSFSSSDSVNNDKPHSYSTNIEEDILRSESKIQKYESIEKEISLNNN